MKRKLIITFFLIIFTGSFLNNLTASNCTEKCHKDFKNYKSHANLKCKDCHLKNKKHYERVLSLNSKIKCFKCHKDFKNILHSEMHTRKKEKFLVNSWFNKNDKKFFSKNCSNCHVSSCFSCHRLNKHNHKLIKSVKTTTCLICHNNYFTGIEYIGLGSRDDAKRYKRGVKFRGEYYMSMIPDIHFEKGMECYSCHNMTSIVSGKKSSKNCRDCHKKIDLSIVEHSIKPHLKKMECYTCHSSWMQVELGTFYLRFKDKFLKRNFKLLSNNQGEYVKSSFYKENGGLLFGINNRNKYSPIRPEFIIFYTYIGESGVIGKENKMLSNSFKATFPHTIRRETVNCEYCHNNKKVYLYQVDENRIFLPDKDGLKIKNFYNCKNYKLLNGRFVNKNELKTILEKSKKYKKLYIKKIKKILTIF